MRKMIAFICNDPENTPTLNGCVMHPHNHPSYTLQHKESNLYYGLCSQCISKAKENEKYQQEIAGVVQAMIKTLTKETKDASSINRGQNSGGASNCH